ncbi:FixH family protein [Geomicrobium sp. JCM 19055]|uniref:FixH family protein n=1 Tax=Geomicrobium sp. JCM 19055 TaxID=1460649 RepID=UPI0012693708|nr:FixH family protein [Geomicrobium sp. JCM 19055]
MLKRCLVAVASCGILVGCANEESDKSATNEMMEIVEVDVLFDYEFEETGNHELAIRISQGDGAIEDAQHVDFEIWKADERANGDIISASHAENGVYEINYTFNESGAYFVQTHVTAKGYHVMPLKGILIGDFTKQDQSRIEEGPLEDRSNYDHSEIDAMKIGG